MAWTSADFIANTEGLERRYKDDNSWSYAKTTTPWKEECQHAWLLYSKASTNALGMLLLGDAKIRATTDLLRNFGMTSGSGLSALNEVWQAARVQYWREKVARPPGGPALQALGPGSILNDKNWTPFLNDAFILGGVHSGQEFHWAEVDFHAATGLDTARAMRDKPYLWEAWRKYLLAGENFWRGGFVRVFARELLGLKAFNYMPIFTPAEIVFKPAGKSKGAFKEYLDALTAVSFDKGTGAFQTINAALGEFLFGDDEALNGLKK